MDVDAGVLPGEVFYAFDLFFERIHLLFTFGSKNKAEVLLSFAKERESELDALDSDKIDRFAESLISKRDNYIMMARNKLETSDIDSVSRQNILWEIDKIVGSKIFDSDEVIVVDDNVVLVDENNSVFVEQEEEQEMVKSIIMLSELQETACYAAETGNTCDTRLVDLGLVTKDNCCIVLGVCC
ncbi:MAG: hypothetical protein K0B07_00555 [DPANN group archaeon]|nr:hypothetical protein [DPANN group archaeon]